MLTIIRVSGRLGNDIGTTNRIDKTSNTGKDKRVQWIMLQRWMTEGESEDVRKQLSRSMTLILIYHFVPIKRKFERKREITWLVNRDLLFWKPINFIRADRRFVRMCLSFSLFLPNQTIDVMVIVLVTSTKYVLCWSVIGMILSSMRRYVVILSFFSFLLGWDNRLTGDMDN